MGTLGVAVDDNVRARALVVEGSDPSNTVASTLGNLRAVVATKGDIVLDIDVVTGLALGSQLAAGRLNEGECTAVMVRRVVAASHEDDHIGALCIELWRSLGRCEGREGADGESLADAERHGDY